MKHLPDCPVENQFDPIHHFDSQEEWEEYQNQARAEYESDEHGLMDCDCGHQDFEGEVTTVSGKTVCVNCYQHRSENFVHDGAGEEEKDL